MKINPSGKHALLWFSLADLPAYAKIVSASLVFYPTAAGGASDHMTVAAYRVTSPWDEAAATWNTSGYGDWVNPGGDGFAVPAGTILVTDKNQEYALELGSLVADWYSGAANNYGVLLAVTSGNKEVKFVSQENGGQPASLLVRYACVCGAPCGSAATVQVERVAFTVENEVRIDGTAYANEDVIVWDPVNGTTERLMDGSERFMEATAIDSLEIVSDSDYIFSFSSNIRLSWQDIEPHDVIGYVPRYYSVSKILDGDDTFLANENIDAFSYLTNGRVLLSTGGPATVGGLSMTDADLVEFDLQTGAAVLVLSELALPVSSNANVDAVQALADGRLILSFDANLQLNGTTVRDGDLALYDPRSQSVRMLFSENDSFDSGGDIKGVFDNRPHLEDGISRLSPVQATYIDQAAKDSNFASEPYAQLGTSEAMLIEFEFSAIPEGATVTSAKLYLALATPPAAAAAVILSVVSNLWVAEDVTWTSFEESNSTVGLSFLAVPPLAGSWVEAEVPPALIHEWIDGVRVNAGLSLSPFLFGGFSVHSRATTTRMLRPQLIIEYTTP